MGKDERNSSQRERIFEVDTKFEVIGSLSGKTSEEIDHSTENDGLENVDSTLRTGDVNSLTRKSLL